ncbi:MAG: metallophosphoesterase family protein [bacterium]
MRPVRFIHCSDLHIDTPFRGIGEVHPDLRDLLHQSTFRSFAGIVEYAISESVDCVLIAGDIFDSAERSLQAQIKFRDGLKLLSDAGIRSFIVYGNHDPLDGWSATLTWPEGVTIFGGKEVESHALERDGNTIAMIHGISFATRDVYENLSLRFERTEPDVPAIGLLHANVGKNTGHLPYAPASLQDLSSRGMDYWALGHLHQHQILRESHPAIVYPGNSQALNPGEMGPKGCCLVTLHPDGACDIRFVPTDTVRYAGECADVSDCTTHDEVIAAVRDRCEGIAEGMEGRHAVIRLALAGRTPLHRELCREGSIVDLTAEIREVFEGRRPWIWIEKLLLKTTGIRDIDALRKGEHFIADIIRLYDELAGDGEDLWRDIRKAGEPLFSQWQGRRYLEAPSREELLRIAEEARNWTLDLLAEEE